MAGAAKYLRACVAHKAPGSKPVRSGTSKKLFSRLPKHIAGHVTMGRQLRKDKIRE